MEAFFGSTPGDETAFRAYFSKLLEIYLETPEGRTRETMPEMDVRAPDASQSAARR